MQENSILLHFILKWLKKVPTPDMDELERAAPRQELIHRPFRRLLAVLVLVDGHDDGALPRTCLMLSAVRRRHRERRGEHLQSMVPTTALYLPQCNN